MPVTRWIRRTAIITAIACATVTSAMSGVALAGPIERALAQEKYYMGGDPERPKPSGAIAQERYYSTYGEPEPLTVSQSPAPSDEFPWAPIAAVGTVLVLAAAGATQIGRLRARRRTARVTA
jgi:hypothetical protein